MKPLFDIRTSGKGPNHPTTFRPHLENLEDRLPPSDMLTGLEPGILLASNAGSLAVDLGTSVMTDVPPTIGADGTAQPGLDPLTLGGSGTASGVALLDDFGDPTTNPFPHGHNLTGSNLPPGGSGIGDEQHEVGGGVHDLNSLPPPLNVSGKVGHVSDDLADVGIRWTYTDVGANSFQIDRSTT